MTCQLFLLHEVKNIGFERHVWIDCAFVIVVFLVFGWRIENMLPMNTRTGCLAGSVGFTIAAMTFTGASHASLSLTLDFSNFGTGGAWSSLHNDAWSGSTSNATKQAAAQSVIQSAADYWMKAFENSTVSLSHTISVGWGAEGGSTLATGGTSWSGSAPYPISNGSLTWDNDGTSDFFVDLTPAENSEWAKASARSADLGGGLVNVERVYYNAPSGSAARSNSDMLSTAIHEIGHALGFLNTYPNYDALDVGNDGDLDLSDGSEIVYSEGHHDYTLLAPETPGFPFDNASIGGNPYYPTVMGPASYSGTRNLLTAVDILTVGGIHGFDNLNLNPLIPEPSSALLLTAGTTCFLRRRRA